MRFPVIAPIHLVIQRFAARRMASDMHREAKPTFIKHVVRELL